jgi:hypothetical protein
MSWKPKVFIGSSNKGKEIAEIVKEHLEENNEIEVKVWWDKIFRIGETYIERLLKATKEFDFALLVITGEDEKEKQGKPGNEDEEKRKVNENVLFELGLFMGRLGRHKAIMLYDDDHKAVPPSDLEGIHKVSFSKRKAGGDLTTALEAPCKEIREYILNPYEDDIRVFEVWKKSYHHINETLEKAPEDATIRIIQTWLPDLEEFIVDIKNLLTETENHKRFKFQVLLIDHDDCNLLNARVKHRTETCESAIKKIQESISQFVKLKDDVDKAWEKEWIESGKRGSTLTRKPELELEICLYNFLPFGSYYQIGDKVMFVGFYLNHCSSIHGPMVKINDTAKSAWQRFENHFTIGWEKARKIYPVQKNNDTETQPARVDS